MSGWLPDGCMWASDLDYYDWLNGREVEDVEPDDIGDTTIDTETAETDNN